MGCIEWSVRGMHEDPEGKVKGRHLAQSQEMGRDQGHATLNVGLHAYFCRTAYNMGIDLLPTTTTLFSTSANIRLSIT